MATGEAFAIRACRITDDGAVQTAMATSMVTPSARILVAGEAWRELARLWFLSQWSLRAESACLYDPTNRSR